MPKPVIEADEIRRIILTQAKRAHVGHIGSALSIADIIAALYGRVLRVEDPADPQRDRFALSKGHAALALYAALHLKGFISAAELDSYCNEGTLLGVHPEHQVKGIDFTTGSLGHGLSYAAGAVLAARLDGSPRKSYALLSDAECNEGSIWEAAMFAAHHRLDNLTAIIDCNGQQALGKTAEVLDLTPLAARWASFGWQVYNVDGHDGAALDAAFSTPAAAPKAIVARTLAGKGVSFMEGQIKWHYLPMSDGEYEQAMAQIAGAP